MFDTDTMKQIKTLVKEHKTTQASLVEQLVRFGLDNADVSTFDLVPAKKRGRPAKEKTEVEEATVTEEVAEAPAAVLSDETTEAVEVSV